MVVAFLCVWASLTLMAVALCRAAARAERPLGGASFVSAVAPDHAGAAGRHVPSRFAGPATVTVAGKRTVTVPPRRPSAAVTGTRFVRVRPSVALLASAPGPREGMR